MPAGRATEGTQSEGTTEVRLQTPRLRCGRWATTAAHISVVWASPEQEAELAVARLLRTCRSRGKWEGWASLTHREPQPGQAGYLSCRALVQRPVRTSRWQQQSVMPRVGPCECGLSGLVALRLVLAVGLFAWLLAQGSWAWYLSDRYHCMTALALAARAGTL